MKKLISTYWAGWRASVSGSNFTANPYNGLRGQVWDLGWLINSYVPKINN